MQYFSVEEIAPVAPYTEAWPSAMSGPKVCGTLHGPPFTPHQVFVHEAGSTVLKTISGLSPSATINALGDIAGAFFEFRASDAYRPYQWLAGEAAALNLMSIMPPGAVDGIASGINASREVVGSYEIPDMGLKPRPYVYKNATGELITLSPPGGPNAYATSINDLHQIVGHLPSGSGFMYDMTSDSYEEFSFIPVGINENGVVLGKRNNATPMLRSGGTDTLLPTFGTGYCLVHGLNNFGRVVGSAATEPGPAERDDLVAFYYDEDGIADLNDRLVTTLPWRLVGAFDINDEGWVVARGYLETDPAVMRGVILKPTSGPLQLPRLPELVMKIFGGVVFGGSGFGLVNGRFVRIPSNNPEDVRRIWSNLSDGQRDALLGVMVEDFAKSLSSSAHKAELTAVASRIVIAGGKAMGRKVAAQRPRAQPLSASADAAAGFDAEKAADRLRGFSRR